MISFKIKKLIGFSCIHCNKVVWFWQRVDIFDCAFPNLWHLKCWEKENENPSRG